MISFHRYIKNELKQITFMFFVVVFFCQCCCQFKEDHFQLRLQRKEKIIVCNVFKNVKFIVFIFFKIVHVE